MNSVPRQGSMRMKIAQLHSWDVDYRGALALQKELASRVKHTRLRRQVRLVGGADCAFTRDGRNIIACVVVLRLPEFEEVEMQWAVEEVKFPYVPGLLSFREAPACIAAVRKLKKEPDVFIVDGQGIAHPRRLGIAAHLGLFFDKPTIGCAKSRLTGQYEEPGQQAGSWSRLVQDGHDIGAVLRTRTGVKPVFVSVGHKVAIDDAIRICLCTKGRYRLPEPTRLADIRVAELKRMMGGVIRT